MHDERMGMLWLMQLADSASPIGAMVHSFGLETLVAEELLTVDGLEGFMRDYISETGTLEAYFCRAAYDLAAQSDGEQALAAWVALNRRLSALKPAREGRAASAMLGKRFLRLVLNLEELPILRGALDASLRSGADAHYCAAFGLVAGALTLDRETMALSYLQQTLIGLVSACQRLLPLGQSQASLILWRLKPVLVTAGERSRIPLSDDEVSFFTPLVDVGGMRHPQLHTRLFMS